MEGLRRASRASLDLTNPLWYLTDMNTTNTIAQEIERHAKVMRGIVDELKKHILSLPDNPRIKRVSGNPHCFIMSPKDLGDNWSVEHHDFKRQYELIVEDLNKCQPDNLIKRLLAIVNEGRLTRDGCRYRQKLHPDVIEHLAQLAGFRWQTTAQWPRDTCDSIGGISTDDHSTKAAAEWVARRLCTEGFGGNMQQFPLSVTVTAVMGERS